MESISAMLPDLQSRNQLDEISASAHEQVKLQYKYMLSILKELESNGIRICRVSKDQ